MSKMKKEEQAVVPAAPEQQAVEALDAKSVMELAEIKGMAPLVQVRQSILKVRRIKLTQKMSRAMDSGLGKPGDFVCDNTEKNYGNTIQIIPLMVSESASYLDKETSQVICWSPNLVTNKDGVRCNQCPYDAYWNDWGTKENKKIPKCKSSLDFTVLVRGEENFYLYEMNFRKNNSPAGRQIVNLMTNDPRKIPFGSAYTLTSVQDTKDQYVFHKIDDKKVSRETLSNDELRSLLPIVKELLQRKKEGQIEVEPEQQGEEVDLPI